MDSYSLIKALHIISSAVLFGTGAGIAFFMLMGCRSADFAARRFAAGMTVKADFLFTLPAAIVQPLTGFWMVWTAGYAWNELWLVVTYALYALAALCWFPVVALQIGMKRMLDDQARSQPFDQAAFDRCFRWWFALGWPAFGGLVVVFWLMVAKPTW